MSREAKTVLITGGGGGIGSAHSEQFAKDGYNVAINDIDREGLETTADRVRELGAEVSVAPGDIADPDEVSTMIDQVKDDLGSVDVLINNAAIFPRNSWEDETWENWKQAMSVNTGGLFNLAQAVIPGMKEQGEGVIINMSSTSAVRGAENKAAYAASKGAVLAVTGQMVRELSPYGIRINAIVPGPIKTQLNKEKWSDPSYMDFIEKNVPIGRMGRPQEIADLAVYLASDKAGFINGAAVRIDGGWTT